MTPLTRITLDPEVMDGKPCIRGMRITVGAIVGLVASGRSFGEILEAYPSLEEADIREALAYTAWLATSSPIDTGDDLLVVVDASEGAGLGLAQNDARSERTRSTT